MAELSDVFFYNSRNGDRKYSADSMTEWLKPFFTTGVFNNQLQVTANNNMTVTIAAGYVNIGGKVRPFRESTLLDMEVASGSLSRIDNVIVRRDDTARDIYLMIQTGGLSANPVPPALVRDNGIYDLKLAEVFVERGTISITQANITDTRMDSNLCGWVMATVKEIDFAQITAQFDAFFSQYRTMIQTDYDSFIAQMSAFLLLYKQYVVDGYGEYTDVLRQYEVDARAFYDAYVNALNIFKQTSEADFNAWFDTIRGILDEEVAGHLLLLIQELQALTPAAVLGTVSHSLGKYPSCQLYKVTGAAGMGGAGELPAGGGNMVTVNGEFELDYFDTVTVKAPDTFKDCTEQHRLDDNMVAFVNPQSDIFTESLVLIMR